MLAGLATRLLAEDDVLMERLFPSQSVLPERWKMYYRKALKTRALTRHTEHALKYAI
jgi:hypothetical protein